jgi:Flp pilus assembly protein TadG
MTFKQKSTAYTGINTMWHREEGSALVEAAITFSVLFMLIFGIFQLATVLWQWNTMQFAVLRAGRYVMVNHATITPAAAEAQMQLILPNASISCPLPSSPIAGNWYVCATQNAGTPPTMSLSASYGSSIIGLTAPLKVVAQATAPLD